MGRQDDRRSAIGQELDLFDRAKTSVRLNPERRRQRNVGAAFLRCDELVDWLVDNERVVTGHRRRVRAVGRGDWKIAATCDRADGADEEQKADRGFEHGLK